MALLWKNKKKDTTRYWVYVNKTCFEYMLLRDKARSTAKKLRKSFADVKIVAVKLTILSVERMK